MAFTRSRGPSVGSTPVVSLPAAFNPYDIGSDYLLGIATDDDGVQFVHSFNFADGEQSSQ